MKFVQRFFSKGDRFLGFFRFLRNRHGEVVLRPVWGRVASLLLVLAVAGWLSAAMAAFLFVKHKRDFQGGNYFHIVFPWKWEEYQRVWGDEFIERAEKALEEGNPREAIHLIRVGFVRSPTNLRGRLMMADVHSAMNRPDRAATVLVDGLPLGGDRDIDYLRTTFQVLLANQEDFRIIEIAEEILGDEVILTPLNQTAALAAGTACFHRGAYDRAEEFLALYELQENAEARLLLARIDWERGDRQAAIDRLERQVQRVSDQDEIYALLTRFYREKGDIDKAHSYAAMRQINDPMNPAARIAMLYTHHAREDAQSVKRGVDRILRDFSDNRGAMLALGEFAANTADPELTLEVFHAMDRAGHGLELAAILVTEAYMEAGRFREALNFLEDQIEAQEEFMSRFRPAIDGLYAVGYYGLGNRDTAEMHLARFLAARHGRVENFVVVSRRIQSLGRLDVARRILDHGHQADPRNQAILTELVDLDLRTGRADDLAGNIEKLLSTRKPSRELLEEAFRRLSGDRFLFMDARQDLLESLKRQLPDRRIELTTRM